MKNFFPLAWAVAANSFVESVRHRFFTLFSIFAFTAIYASVLAGVMAVEEEARVLTDLGLALMELSDWETDRGALLDAEQYLEAMRAQAQEEMGGE